MESVLGRITEKIITIANMLSGTFATAVLILAVVIVGFLVMKNGLSQTLRFWVAIVAGGLVIRFAAEMVLYLFS